MKKIIFFDSQCPLCLRLKQALERILPQSEYEFFDINSSELNQRYPDLDIEACKKEIHMKDNNKIYVGEDVLAEIIKSFPIAKKLSWLVDTDAGKKTTSFFYNKVEDLKNKIKDKCSKC